MRWLSGLLVLCLVAQERSTSISGTVVDAVSGAPIAGANIHLGIAFVRKGTPLPPLAGVVTGVDGKFTANGLEPGMVYDIAAEHPRFPQPRTLLRVSQSIALEAGESTSDVVLKLLPGGAISGRVADEDGEPLTGCQVNILHRPDAATPVAFAMTDDRGEYRAFHIPAGSYFVRVSCHRSVPQERKLALQNSVRESTLSYTPVYFPRSRDASEATRVNVAPGADVQGVDLQLSPVTTYEIAGQVEFPSGIANPSPFFQLSLVARGRENSLQSVGVQNGKFRIWNVPAGSYWLTPVSPVGNVFYGRVPVDVENRSVTGIQVRLMPAMTMPVTWETDQGSKDEGTRPGEVPFGLRSVNDPWTRRSDIREREPGKWILENLTPGQWILQGFSYGYVRASRIGGRTMEGSVIEIRDGETGPLHIWFGTKMANLTGSVEGANTTIFFQAIPSHPFGHPLLAGSDESGKFQSTLAPGEYRVTAIQEVDGYLSFDPAISAIIAELGATVKLEAGQTINVQLKTLTRETVERKLRGED